MSVAAGGESSREAAQRRADRIAAYRAEVAQLRREGVVPLDRDQLAAVSAHHDEILRRLARDFDVDRTTAARRMSRGMQLASVLGAAALVAAVVSFFYRVWDSLGTAAQVLLLTTAPIGSTLAMIAIGRLERTRYVASLCALVACGAFVLQTVALGRLFNFAETVHAVGAWSVFALAIAWPWRLAVPFALGMAALPVYLGGAAYELAGFGWTEAIPHPEPVMLTALALLLAAPRRLPSELAGPVRGVLLAEALLPLLLLSSITGLSLVPVSDSVVRPFYQIAGLAAAVGVNVWGLRRGDATIVAIGSIFAGLLIVTRFVDWWWDWMPKYLFFLILGAIAIAWLLGLRVARARLEART